MLEILQVSTQEYFDLPYASNSGIKEAHKLFTASDTGEREPNAAYRFGGAFDALSTDHDEFSSHDLSDPDVAKLTPMKRALNNNGIYASLFKQYPKQIVFVDKEWSTMIDGMEIAVPVKCKYDLWNPKFIFGGDIKVTQARDQKAFNAAAKFFKYPCQGAWYMDITKTDRFVFIAVSKINDKIFTINMTRDSAMYEEGKKDYLTYLKSWWKLYGIGMASS